MGYAKSDDTKRRLLSATGRLLRARGYAATGLSAIVKESCVPKGSLYHHFPGGKAEVAGAAVARSGRAVVERLTELADRAGDPIAAVRAFCDGYVEQLRASAYQRGCPLATVALEAAPDVDEVHAACAEAFDGIVALIAERLEARGLTPEAARAEATHTVSAIEGALVLAKAKRDVRPVELVRDRLVRDLERAIAEAKEGAP
ncbi:MAG: TetR/AcrR family transcriptional regulator [Myxococcota bacterium]